MPSGLGYCDSEYTTSVLNEVEIIDTTNNSAIFF